MAFDLAVREKDLQRLIESHLLNYARQVRYELLEELIDTLPSARLGPARRVLDIGDVIEWLRERMEKEKGP